MAKLEILKSNSTQTNLHPGGSVEGSRSNDAMDLRQNFFFKEANILRRVVRAVANEIRTETNSTP